VGDALSRESWLLHDQRRQEKYRLGTKEQSTGKEDLRKEKGRGKEWEDVCEAVSKKKNYEPVKNDGKKKKHF